MNGINVFESQIITNGSMTGTSVITSSAVNTLRLIAPTIQFVWTGTPNGTFQIQCSNDGVTWGNVTLSTSITATGSASDAEINLFPWGFKWFRCTYTNSSSTGTLNAFFCGKSAG